MDENNHRIWRRARAIAVVSYDDALVDACDVGLEIVACARGRKGSASDDQK